MQKYWLLPCSLLLFSPEVFGRLCPTTFHFMMTSHRIKKTQFRFVSGVSFSGVQSTGCCPALCFSSLQRSLEALLYYLSSHDDFPQNKELNFVLCLGFRFQLCKVLAVALLFASLLSRGLLRLCLTTFHFMMTSHKTQNSISFCFWCFVFKCGEVLVVALLFASLLSRGLLRLCLATFQVMMTSHKTKYSISFCFWDFVFKCGKVLAVALLFASLLSRGLCEALSQYLGISQWTPNNHREFETKGTTISCCVCCRQQCLGMRCCSNVQGTQSTGHQWLMRSPSASVNSFNLLGTSLHNCSTLQVLLMSAQIDFILTAKSATDSFHGSLGLSFFSLFLIHDTVVSCNNQSPNLPG